MKKPKSVVNRYIEFTEQRQDNMSVTRVHPVLPNARM